MITTLGNFLNSLQRDTYFVSEAEADGTRCYYPIEDLESIPGDDPIWNNPIVVLWIDEHTALINTIKADGLTKVIVSKQQVFVTPPPPPPCLYPVRDRQAISEHAREQAMLDEAWMQDDCTDRTRLEYYAREFAAFERNVFAHLTDNFIAYAHIYAKAYALHYVGCVSHRRAATWEAIAQVLEAMEENSKRQIEEKHAEQRSASDKDNAY